MLPRYCKSVSEQELNRLEELIMDAEFEKACEMIKGFQERDPFDTLFLEDYLTYMDQIDQMLDEEDNEER